MVLVFGYIMLQVCLTLKKILSLMYFKSSKYVLFCLLVFQHDYFPRISNFTELGLSCFCMFR